MKKFLLILLSAIVIITGIFILLNMNTTTRQGINYQWHTIRIPVYLKILDFYDRHYNYKELVKRITNNRESKKDKVMKLFKWTCYNIKKIPEGMPVIDDHVWHIIIRGYGAPDQSSDVFTTLCNYAGAEAFYSYIYTKDKASRIPVSFVKIKGIWSVFDPATGIYFKDKSGNLASVEVLKSGKEYFQEFLVNEDKKEVDYKNYFAGLQLPAYIDLQRSSIQSPFNRLVFEVKRMLIFKNE